MKKAPPKKKLSIKVETLRKLTDAEMAKVVGGHSGAACNQIYLMR